MSTEPGTVTFIEDQLSGLPIRTARMFGEYAIYCDDKVVGFICDDTLLLKPLVGGRLDSRTEVGHPYPGSKEYRAVPGDALEDREWLVEMVSAIADALPVPKPKKPKVPRTAKGSSA